MINTETLELIMQSHKDDLCLRRCTPAFSYRKRLTEKLIFATFLYDKQKLKICPEIAEDFSLHCDQFLKLKKYHDMLFSALNCCLKFHNVSSLWVHTRLPLKVVKRKVFQQGVKICSRLCR